MSKIQDIIDSGRAPGVITDTPKVDHDSVYHKAPLGLAAVESQPLYRHGPATGASRMSKYFGMPVSFIKDTWNRAPIVLLLLCFCFASKAGDLTPGLVFVDGQRVSAAQLGQLVSGATIANTFISSKPTDPSLQGSDTFIIFSPTLSGLYQVSANAAFLQNTNLITAQSVKATPVVGDYLLLFDSVGNALAKVSAGSLVLSNTNLIAGQPFIWSTNLSAGLLIPILNNGTNGSTTFSNALSILEYLTPLTNLLSHTAPTNNDGFLVWDSLHGTNKLLTFTNLFTTLPVITKPTNTDLLLIWSTGTNSLDPVGGTNFIAAISPQNIGPRTIMVTNLPCTNQAILSTNISFQYTPWVRASLVITNASVVGLSYVNGDEIPLERVYDSAATRVPAFTFGANMTNAFLNANFSYGGGLNIPQKGGSAANAALFNESPTNFSIRLYITYFPPQ